MNPEKGDVLIMPLDSKSVPQVRTSHCESSVAVAAECAQDHSSWNIGSKEHVVLSDMRQQSSAKREAPVQTVIAESNMLLGN